MSYTRIAYNNFEAVLTLRHAILPSKFDPTYMPVSKSGVTPSSGHNGIVFSIVFRMKMANDRDGYLFRFASPEIPKRALKGNLKTRDNFLTSGYV